MTTGSMTVDTGGEWLVVLSICSSILISENAQLGTAEWIIQAPKNTSPAVTIPAGAARTLTQGRFLPGDKVAFLSAVTGSMTFTWEEQ